MLIVGPKKLKDAYSRACRSVGCLCNFCGGYTHHVSVPVGKKVRYKKEEEVPCDIACVVCGHSRGVYQWKPYKFANELVLALEDPIESKKEETV